MLLGLEMESELLAKISPAGFMCPGCFWPCGVGYRCLTGYKSTQEGPFSGKARSCLTLKHIYARQCLKLDLWPLAAEQRTE
jgi:hypothetical protein